MQRCAVYLQPSGFEGFGLAALEAMACGAPVVASAGGALPEVIGDGGLAVPEPTSESLAAAVELILGSPTRAAEISARGVARARERFAPARRADALAAVMEQVTRGRR